MPGRAVALLAITSLVGCPGPRHPREPAAAPLSIPLGGDARALRGVAGNGTLVVAALTAHRTTTVEAHRGQALAWRAALEGNGGPVAATPELVLAALGGTGSIAGAPVRGEPGAAIVALHAATGAVRWRVSLDASEWVIVTALAADADGILVGGSFSGSVRAGSMVVSSGGRADGFVARLTATGEIAWLVRMGGGGPDAVQGVAVRDGRIAIAGTFAPGADLLGLPLPAHDERSPFTDAFVAELGADGTRRWAATFGSKLADSVVGVALDAEGRLVVAATARDVVHLGGADLAAQGPADGLVGWWAKDGGALGGVLVGGADFDGLRAITAAGDHVIVGGFYSGALQLGDRTLTAAGGDDAFLAALDHRGSVIASWPVTGAGREEITALGAVPGGFVAGVGFTAAASIAGAEMPAPPPPRAGAAVIVRPYR